MLKLKGLDFTRSRNWLRKAENYLGDDPVVAFLFGWFDFNHYYSTFAVENKEDLKQYGSGDKIELLFLVSRGEFQEFFEDYRKSYPQRFNVTIELPVVDILHGTPVPDGNAKTCKLSDLSNEKLFRVIYQIRNNLFHGNKDPDRVTRDQTLCGIAGNFMIPFLDALLNATYGENQSSSSKPVIDEERDRMGAMKLEAAHTPPSSETLQECLSRLDAEDLYHVDALKDLGEILCRGSIDSMRTLLKHKDEHVRFTAVWAMGQTRNPVAIEVLITALEDEDNHVQHEAAKALGKFNCPNTIEVLKETARNKSGAIRGSALLALAKLGVFDLELSLGCLEDQSWSVKKVAARVLGKMKREVAIQPLIDEIEHEQQQVEHEQWELDQALDEQERIEEESRYENEYEEEFGDEEIDDEDKLDGEDDENEIDDEDLEDVDGHNAEDVEEMVWFWIGNHLDRIEYGEGYVDPLLFLGTPASLLAKIGAPAVEPLLSFLSNTSIMLARFEMLNILLEIIGETSHPKVFEFALKALKGPSAQLRDYAIRILEKLRDPRAVEPLISFVSDNAESEDYSVHLARYQALEVLSKIDHPKVFDFVLDMLKDPDTEVKNVVIRVLGKLRDPRAIQPLIELAGVNSHNLDESILNSLVEIGAPVILSLFGALLKLKWMEGQYGAYEDREIM
jgi:HEAT repeat protein